MDRPSRLPVVLVAGLHDQARGAAIDEPLHAAGVTYIDYYQDTDLLRRFISDRGKIRSRRLTRRTVQRQSAGPSHQELPRHGTAPLLLALTGRRRRDTRKSITRGQAGTA